MELTNVYYTEALEKLINNSSFKSFNDLKEASFLTENLIDRILSISEIIRATPKNSPIENDLKAEEDVIKKLMLKLKENVSKNAPSIRKVLKEIVQDPSKEPVEIAEALQIADMFSREFEIELVKTLPPKGIINIVNSCYLNSSIQALIGNDAFKNFLMNPVWFKALKQEAMALAANKGYNDLVARLPGFYIAWEYGKDFDDVADRITYSSDKNEQAFIEELYQDFARAKKIQQALQGFIIHLDASKDPSEMEDSAKAVRAALFATGIFGEDEREQQDAAAVLELVFKLMGFTNPFITYRSVPSEKIETRKAENLGLMPIPIIVNGKEPIYVQNLIDSLFTEKTINDPENAWYANEKFHPQYNERISIGFKAPERIALQLKRFEGNGRGQRKIQNDLLLPKDHILNLSKGIVAEPALYKVTGAIHHDGDIGGGHYRAFTLKGGEWYEADDRSIRKAKNIDKELATAYILLLEKISP